MAVTLDAKGGVLRVVDGDKRYQLIKGGLATIVDAGETPTQFQGNDAKRLLNQALIEVEENGSKLSKEVKAALHNTVDNFAGAEAGRLQRVKDALGAVKTLEKVSDKAAIEATLTKNPLAGTLLTEAAEKKLAAHNFDLAAFNAEAKAVAEKVAKVTALNTELTGMMTAETPDLTKIKAFIKTNQAHLSDLNPSDEAIAKLKLATPNQYDFKAAKTHIFSEIDGLATKAAGHVQEIVDARDIIATKPPAEELKLATDTLAKAEKELGDILSHEYAGVIKSKLPQDLLKEVSTVHPEMGAKLGAVAADAAKSGGGKWYSIFKGEEALAATAKAKNVAVKELGVLSKIRPGKTAAVAGIGAVLAYTLAGTGNKGPGERAEAAGKAAEPALGRA